MIPEIKEGYIIRTKKRKDDFHVEMVQVEGNVIKVAGHYLNSREPDYFVLTPKDFKEIEIITNPLDFKGNPESVFLVIEGERYYFASLYDPILAVSVSKIAPLPFQIDAVYNYILKNPQIRFLLADDPGAGKTIMAGMTIKELKLRGLAERILIVAPGHLVPQWKREMKEKFQEDFVIVNRDVLKTRPDVFYREKQIIASIDFLKQDDIRSILTNVYWDITIVDEAHKMAAYKYGNKVSKTKRYYLGEVLSDTSTHLLFLTATPHKGDPNNFLLLFDLLLPGYFKDINDLIKAIKSKKNTVFLRRMKEDLVDFNGEKIFKPRYSHTITFKLSEREKEIYDSLTAYLKEQYVSMASKRKVSIFPLIIFQRRFASSMWALYNSLKRRREKLQEQLNQATPTETQNLDVEDFIEIDDLEERERWKIEEKLETAITSTSKVKIEEEIFTIDRIIQTIESFISREEETKYKKLLETIQFITDNYGRDEKILIFTEFKDTLDYLVDKLQKLGYSVTYIHGKMPLEERLQREKEFKKKAQIMVATEAAGEGINLQFCHLVINYDIPWNPNRIEQRIGRVHRYGQKHEVHIFNFVAQNTREGIVLERLLKKLEEIRNSIGDKVFDVIGEIVDAETMYKMLSDVALGKKSEASALREEDKMLDNNEVYEKLRLFFERSLVTEYMDLSQIHQLLQKAEENRLSPEYVEEYFIRVMRKLNVKIREKEPHIYSVPRVPKVIHELAKTKGYIDIKSSYPAITFDKRISDERDDVEFVTFGHPLFEAAREWVRENLLKDLQRGAVFYDPGNKLHGTIWFFEGEVQDGFNKTAGKTLIAIYDDGENFHIIDPKIVWDLEPAKDAPEVVTHLERKEDAAIYALGKLQDYKDKILEERKRQAEIKEHSKKSLEKLINQLDEQLANYYSMEETENKRKIQANISAIERKLNRYVKIFSKIDEQIQRETSLLVLPPAFIGAIYVLPRGDMKEDREIEKIGMETVMNYELAHGRIPKDVSAENLGYDIYSEGNGEKRYIEVKARAHLGDVELTWNEYVTAKRLCKKYWLYVVLNAKTTPTIYIINDPANNMNIIEKHEIRYKVPLQELMMKASKEEVIKNE